MAFSSIAATLGARLAAFAALGPLAASTAIRRTHPASPAVQPDAAAGGWGLCLAIGLGVLGCAASLLAAVGRLTVLTVGLLLIAAAMTAGPAWPALVSRLRSLTRTPYRALAMVTAASVLPGALLALYPPTGFDALLYHLPAARAFALSGGLHPVAGLRFPIFPWLNEILAAAALLLQDDIAAQLLQVAAWAGTGAMLWEWGRRRYGPGAAALAAGLWLGSPLAAWLAASLYVEPLIAMFTLAAVIVLDATHDGAAAAACALDPADVASAAATRGRSSLRLVLAGGLAGCAASTKYLGLPAVVLVAAWCLLRAPRGRRLHATALALSAATAVALPWYLWIAHTTGDPLYPLLSIAHHARTAAAPALAARLQAVASLPWSLIAGRQSARPFYPPGSPLLLLLWPLPLLTWRRFPALRPITVSALALGLILAATAPDARTLSIAAPLFAAAVAGAVAALAHPAAPADPAPHAIATEAFAAGAAAAQPATSPASLHTASAGPLPLAAPSPTAPLRSAESLAASPALRHTAATGSLLLVPPPSPTALLRSAAEPPATSSSAARAVVALALVAQLPVWLYAGHLAHRRGPLPADAAARTAYLRRQVPGFGALAWLNAGCGAGCAVYALWGENLRYYAAGGFAGDWFGTLPFSEALALGARPALLHTRLRQLGISHVLVVRRAPGQAPRAAPLFSLASTCFHLAYQDAEADLLALTPDSVCAATAGGAVARTSTGIETNGAGAPAGGPPGGGA
jgi:hypothetical protein